MQGLSRTLKRVAAACLAIGAVALAGCGSLVDRAPAEPDAIAPDRNARWEAHARALSGFRSWTMHGALVVRSGEETSRATLRWRQARDSFLMRFSGPLGVGLFEIHGSGTSVEARFANGRRVRAESPEALLEREVGWSVPLGGLRYWIVGAPMPGGPAARGELDDRGRLARLEQAGWTVVYEKYGGLGDLALPVRIRLSTASVDSTVVVRRWTASGDPG